MVGGGYIGLELGTFFSSLGTGVTVVEMLPGLLRGVDRDLAGVLKKRLDRKIPLHNARDKTGFCK